MEGAAHEFPVELRRVVTIDGLPVPRTRAVVRTDTNEALSTVSDRYSIVEHGTLLKAAHALVDQLGEPQVSFNVSRGGAVFTAEFVYRGIQEQLGLGEPAGLKVFIQNAYLAGWRARVKIGALVLKCLNGMVIPRTVFDIGIVHRGKLADFLMPEPEEILEVFARQGAQWRRLGDRQLGEDEGVELLRGEPFGRLAPESSIGRIQELWLKNWLEKGERTAWHLLQHTTYHVTHETPRLSYLGRMQRLERVVRFFNTHFSS